LGELLSKIEHKPKPDGSHKGTFGGSQKSLPSGISKRESHQAQTLAKHPELVEEVIEETKKEEIEGGLGLSIFGERRNIMEANLKKVTVLHETTGDPVVNVSFDDEVVKLCEKHGLKFNGSGFNLKTEVRDLSFEMEKGGKLHGGCS
jgi:hypothetical protein